MDKATKEGIAAYRKTFGEEIERRRQALKMAEDVANLGTGVTEKGMLGLAKGAGLNVKKLEKSNRQLSKQIEKRARKVDQQLSSMPRQIKEERKNRLSMKKELAAKEGADDPCLWRPDAIFAAPVRTCRGCVVEITENERVGRSYPVLVVRGSGTNGLRIAEVQCLYLWAFVPESTGVFAISAEIEFSGRIVQTREYHCYSDTSGTGWEYELRMGHDQAGRPSAHSVLEGTIPYAGGAMRYDGTRHANHMATLDAGRPTYVYLVQRFTVSARSRYASVSFNFGAPSRENYIDIPWMCWERF